MKLISLKILTLLLLPALLLAGTGNVFGYAWCLSDDGHAEIEYVGANGCNNGETQERDVIEPEFMILHNSGDKHCAPCVDFSLQKNNATVVKRTDKVPTLSFNLIAARIFPVNPAQELATTKILTQQMPRTSQSLLALRTIVLLN